MGTSKITETSRVTNGNWLTLVALCTCPGCRRCSGSCQNLTDVPDGLCASCRAWRTCDDLVEGVRNTLEKFFDARYQPHDGTGNYYSDEPAPEFDLAYDQILGAIDETGGGIKKLIELALQRRVDMWQHLEPRGEEGISFWMRWREVLFSFFSLTPSVPPSGFVVDLGLEMGQEHASLVALLELTESQED